MALTTNLLSYWKLDESSGNAADSVGSLTLTNTNTTPFVAGKINNGTDLEATSSQYFVNSDPASMDGMSEFSISLWLNFESLTDDRMPVTKWGATLATDQAWRLILASSKLTLVVGNGSTTGTITPTTTLSTSTWYHFVYTWKGASSAGSRGKVYINGTNVTSSDGTPSTMLAGTADFIIGNRTGLPAGGYFDGIVDEVGIWNRELTAGEASQLYNGGQGSQYAFTDVDIALDSTSNGTFTTTSPLVWSHTCAGTDRILFVAVDSLTDSVTGVTYNGVSMTLVDKTTYPGAGRRGQRLYYLVAPATGANNISASFSGANCNGGSISYTGAKQTGQPDSSNTKAQGTSEATMTIATTVVASNCWQIACSIDDQGSGGTGLNGAVVRQTNGQGMMFGDSNAAVSTGSQTITYDFAGSNAIYGAVTASIAPTASAATNSNFLMFM